MNLAGSTSARIAPGGSREGAPLHAGTDTATFQRGRRADGGTLRRFEAVPPHANRQDAALPSTAAPVIEGRTVFPSTVVEPLAPIRVLVSGHNNPKLGRAVTRSRWAGMPIFHLTLEERATCPSECHLWRECYGNAMHQARRHRHGQALERRLGADLCSLALENPGGFVVRLHTLGDFYSVEYAARWAIWLGMHPELRVFGFTAHPVESVVGAFIREMNAQHPDRCAIRFSSADPGGEPMTATTIWRQPEAPVVAEGIVCPAQTGAQDCCGTCGMCWAHGARGKSIVFVGHGMRKRAPAGPREPKKEAPPVADPWPEGELERRLTQAPPKGWTSIQWSTVCTAVARGDSYGAAARAARLSTSQVIGVAHRRAFPAREDPTGRGRGGYTHTRTSRGGMGACGLEEAQARSLNQIADPLPTAERDAVAALDGFVPSPVAQPREASVGGASSNNVIRGVFGPARPIAPAQPQVAVIYRTCRWPIGEPGTASFRFCASTEVVPEKPYCSEHCALAYIPRGPSAAFPRSR